MLAVKQNEALDPLHILRFCANAVMFHPDLVADLIEQFRRSGFRCDFSVHNIALLCTVVKNKQGVKIKNQPNSTLYRRRIYTDFGVNITLGTTPCLASEIAAGAKQFIWGMQWDLQAMYMCYSINLFPAA